MAHEVFVSYSHHDKPQADAVCAKLEAKGIRCWIAPRDVVPGQEWGAAIVEAIRSSRVMVLVFSSHANASPQIRREVQLAVSAETVLIPFRIEDVAPAESLEYFLGTPHWLDALTVPLEAHLERLATAVASFLAVSKPVGSRADTAATPEKSFAKDGELTLTPRPSATGGANFGSEPVLTAQAKRRTGLIVAVVAAVVVLISGILSITGYLLLRHPRASQTSAAQPTPAAGPVSNTRPPSAAPTSALDGLLLGVDQINTAMNTTGMTAVGTMTTLPDHSSWVSDQACLPLSAAGQATVYAGAGWSNVRIQVVANGQQNAVDQAVVLFSSAHDAGAFFSASAKGWQACSDRQFLLGANGNSQVNTVGPVSNTNGTLSATVTPANSMGVCERALTVAFNIAVDVTACVGPPGVAVNIAHQIAAKVISPR
jgi:serine/threonine-protein kinase